MIRDLIKTGLRKGARILHLLADEFDMPAEGVGQVIDPLDDALAGAPDGEEAVDDTGHIDPGHLDKAYRSAEQELLSMLGEEEYILVVDRMNRVNEVADRYPISPLVPHFRRGPMPIPGTPGNIDTIQGPPLYKHGAGMFLGRYRGYDLYVSRPQMGYSKDDNPIDYSRVHLIAKYGNHASISARATDLVSEERMPHNDPLFEAYNLASRFGVLPS